MSVVYVPVSMPVKKYFLKEFQSNLIEHNQAHALKLSRSDFLGNFVACLMTKDLTDWKLSKPQKESLCLVLSRRFDSCYLPEAFKIKLAYHLEQLFKREFCLYIDMSVNFGMPALQAVDNFCRMYAIEENDYGQDNMYRYYTRYGKKHIASKQAHTITSKPVYHSRPIKSATGWPLLRNAN